MINSIKKLFPRFIFNFYHKTLAVLANLIYNQPSEKLIVMGVTGTNGKTSTCSFIAKILEEAGYKVGMASTAIFKVAEKEWLNDKKMTMLGRFQLQKLLKQMVSVGCHYAVIETSSQGIEQFRHLGLHYDICVFTNLTPEHLEAHGGFENYKNAKLKLFKHLENLPIKSLNNKKINKIIVANSDDQYASEFLDFKVAEKITFGINSDCDLKAKDIGYHSDGVDFKVADVDFKIKLFGKFNVYNCLSAMAVAKSQLVDYKIIQKALSEIKVMPGRVEFIENDLGLKLLVDYAPEPESLRQLFETIELHNLKGEGKIIHVFGSCGGGRDVSRRPVLGEISAEKAEIQIITNEDPYDDDPEEIINQVAEGVLRSGKTLNKEVFKVLKRKEAIKLALSLAKTGDLLIFTGKGSEQAICVKNNKKIAWDEREVIRGLLRKG